MADGKVEFSTKIDESGLDKGLKSVKNKVESSSKDIGKGSKGLNTLKTAFNETGGAAASFAEKMSSVATSGGALAAGITAAVAAAKKYIETLKQANEAYKVQEKAEKALRNAAKNNPYLNRDSVARLQEYASELQKISNYGDEATIDVMAQLAATGRNEAEIMKIMGAAADYAAAKHIDLSTAAQTLNATYSGAAGLMGRQIDDIKDLTEEQLKNGDAIDLIANKYKGFAQQSVDSSTQAKNAFGDFMESVGKMANPMFEGLNQRATAFWEKMTAQMQKFNDALETASRKWGIGGTKRAVDEGVEAMSATYTNRNTGEEKRAVEMQTTEYLQWLKEELEWREKLTAEEENVLFEIDMELKQRERLVKYEQQQAEAAKKTTEETKKAQATQKTADDLARESNKKLQENLKALEIEAKAKGEAVSVQDQYNVYLQSYIDLLTKTNGLIKEGYPVEQKRLQQLEEAKAAVDAAADAEKRLAAAMQLTQAATETINSIKRELTPAAELQEQISSLEELKQKIQETSEAEIAAAQAGEEKQLSKTELIKGLTEVEKSIITEKVDAVAGIEESWWQKYENRQQELLELKQELCDSEVLSEEEKYEKMKQLDEAYKQSKASQISDLMGQVSSYTSQIVGIINQAASVMLKAVEDEAKAEQAAIEEKYLKGEISEEEYNEAITESKKKAAEEQYKIQMVQWAASILQATANIAEGVTKAIAQGGVAGIVSGAIVSAAGAVQLASIIASKPTPPSFSTGGIVGGSSYYGDNVAANLNSREMVMNQAEQKGLWEFINGGSKGTGGGVNIVVNNNVSNMATAQPKITRDKIEIMIDARVNESLKNGRYDDSLNQAQQGMSGDYYGI